MRTPAIPWFGIYRLTFNIYYPLRTILELPTPEMKQYHMCQTLGPEWTISVPVEVLISQYVRGDRFFLRMADFLYRVMFTTGVRVSRISYQPCENNAPLSHFIDLWKLPGASHSTSAFYHTV